MDESRQCTAKSKQSQQRCKRAAILGGRVCKMHGGGIPAVKRAAAERIRAMVDPALSAIEEIIADVEHPARLAAARDILDRAGFAAHEEKAEDRTPHVQITIMAADQVEPAEPERPVLQIEGA